MVEARDPDPAAMELALGLLDGDERGAALRRQLADPGFAGEVADWRARFASLFVEAPEVAPPADLAARVAASARGPRRGSLATWRAVAAGASAIAASLALVVVLAPRRTPVPVAPAAVATAPATLFLAVLTPQDSAPIAAAYESGAGRLRLAGSPAVPSGRTAQLWVIPAGGVPHPLGLLPAGGVTLLALDAPSRRLLRAGATLAISIEPAGGSPTGQPTGPVIATGALSRT